MSTRELWRRALGRGASLRYLALFVTGLLLPTALAFVPIASFFQSLFDRSPRAAGLVAALDSSTVIDVVRQLGEPAGAGIGQGLTGALLLALIVAPALAGATAAMARGGGSSSARALLGGAATYYGRMLRMVFAAAIPFGIAGGIAAALFHLAGKSNETAMLESAARRTTDLATVASVLVVWLAHATVEAGRAHLAVQPERRSALLAWWSGARFTARHPGQVLGLCLVTTLLGVGLAALVTALRMRVVQAGAGSIALAFVLGQVAVAAIGWGRSSRLVGLVELIRAERSGG